MSDEHDIIVIGAGHNGLTAAIELALAGRSVLVMEAQGRSGGCATTTEPLLAGFRHNPHANTFLFADLMPEQIAPASVGVDVLQPAAQIGIAFADGRPPVILHRPDLLARTRASLALYSRADARTYLDLKKRSARLGPLLRRGLYAAPDPKWFEAQRSAVQSAFCGLCDLTGQNQGTARELIDALFEAAEVRMLIYSLALETGVGLEEPGGDLAFLGYALWIAGRWRIPVGGMQAYSNALHRTALARGVRVMTSTRAARIITKGRRAVGVEASSGTVYGASQAVLAAMPILHLFDGLLDADASSATERAELAAFRQATPTSIGTSAFCLNSAPHYKSAHHDTEIDACLKTVIGYQTPTEVLEHHADVRAGRLPRAAGVVRIHSQWDEGLAPRPCHIAAVDSPMPATGALDEQTWGLVDQSFPTAFLETWRTHCSPGGLPEPLAMAFERSSAFERRMLLRLGSGQYRSSIERLYLAGPGVYPGGGVHGACGRNAARTILDDTAPTLVSALAGSL